MKPLTFRGRMTRKVGDGKRVKVKERSKDCLLEIAKKITFSGEFSQPG